eukprot:scaffold156339_cov32-Tisochrysis_lutea.AAC.3
MGRQTVSTKKGTLSRELAGGSHDGGGIRGVGWCGNRCWPLTGVTQQELEHVVEDLGREIEDELGRPVRALVTERVAAEWRGTGALPVQRVVEWSEGQVRGEEAVIVVILFGVPARAHRGGEDGAVDRLLFILLKR